MFWSRWKAGISSAVVQTVGAEVRMAASGARWLPCTSRRPRTRPSLPGNDACVDLLVLRRHFGHRVDGMLFGPTRPRLLAGHRVPVNEYFLAKPRQVLGEISARPTPSGSPEVTVEPRPGSSPLTSLSPRLDDIVDHAHAVGLSRRRSYTESVPAVPPRKRPTTRLRAAAGGGGGRSGPHGRPGG
jgi:hypothetical protein